MKKLLLLFSIALSVLSVKSQNTCSTAQSFTAQGAGPIETQLQTIKWYKFTSKSTKVKITLVNRSSSGSDKANKFILWSGSCGSLSQVEADTLTSGSDSVLRVTTYSISNSTNYYIEVRKSNSTDTVGYSIGLNFRVDVPMCSECDLEPSTTCELLCNGSFENMVSGASHPTGVTPAGGNLDICGWENATAASPDYFTTGGSGGAGIPATWMGNQAARTGDAMVGFFANTPFMGNWHEYIYQRLSTQLTPGVTYTLSFYVKPAPNTTSYAGEIGAWLTDSVTLDSFSTTTSVISGITPQVMFSGFVNNTSNWTLVTGSFTATGNETRIVLGNFGNTMSNNSNNYVSYYFLDDVSLSRAPMCNNITYDFTIPAGNVYTSALTGGYTPVTISNWNLYVT
ncbi:MAG: hypothetical protein JNL69_06470, partial [Bacteroidia bacterium]|nr:hypothetical protein [Bacteroidia bacterium]